MRNVMFSSKLMSKRMINPQERVGKRDTSNGGSVVHPFTGGLIVGFLNGSFQVFKDQAHGFQTIWSGKFRAHYTDIALEGMRKSVETSESM